MSVDMAAKSTLLLEEKCRDLRSDLARYDSIQHVQGGPRFASKGEMVAARGASIHACVEFLTRIGFLTADEALASVRQGLGDALTDHRDSLVWATEDFQRRMASVLANSFGRNPNYPFNHSITKHADPRDRVKSWCEAQGAIFLIVWGTYDRMSERRPDRHRGSREDQLKRQIASTRAQVEIAVELQLISVEAALDHILQGMHETLERAKSNFPSVTDESYERIKEMVGTMFTNPT